MIQIIFENQYATYEQSAALQAFKIPVEGHFKWIAYNEGKEERRRLVCAEKARDLTWKLYQRGKENILRVCEAYSCAELETFCDFIRETVNQHISIERLGHGSMATWTLRYDFRPEIQLGIFRKSQGAHWRAQMLLACLNNNIIQAELFADIQYL